MSNTLLLKKKTIFFLFWMVKTSEQRHEFTYEVNKCRVDYLMDLGVFKNQKFLWKCIIHFIQRWERAVFGGFVLFGSSYDFASRDKRELSFCLES